MSERRIESRYLCADLVKVEWLDGENRLRTDEAVLEDICAAGSCVQLEHPIPPGSDVMLSIHGEYFMGSTRYCLYRDDGYFVGIRFADETVWSVDKVVPGHLTSLRDLARGSGGR